jgi:hypothetical protein
MSELLGHLSRITLSEEGARRAVHGNAVAPEHVMADATTSARGGNHVGLFDSSGTLLAVAERRADASLQPLTVLV